MTITITLPLPHKNLSPNARCHWAAKAKAAKMARYDAKRATLRAIALLDLDGLPLWKSATVQATFYKRTSHVTDSDNALASLKNAFDGLADAGLIANDRGLTHLPVKFAVDKNDPRVELTVTKGDAQ